MPTKEQVINAYRELIKCSIILENDKEVLFNAELENRINNETETNLENIFNSILYLTKLTKEAIENQ